MSEYAGLVTRTLALAADALLLNAGVAITTTVVGLALSVFGAELADLDVTGVVAGACIWWVIAGAYFVAFWTLTEQTPGMRALRLEVESDRGGRLSVGQGLLRYVGMFLAAIPFFAGYLLILWDPRRRGLHDKLAGSVVRYKPAK